MLIALLRTPVTLITLIACAVIYFMQTQNDRITSQYRYQYFQIKQGQYYRFLTGGFLHANTWHLLMNLYSLYNLGTVMERYLGSIPFAVILIGSVIVGNLFCYMMNVHAAVGLSGGLYGIMFVYICVILKHSSASLITILRYNLANILINFLPGVAWQAHLGGAVFGILAALLLRV